MTAAGCADCGRQVTLRGVSPQGRLCSACVARRRRGLCAACGRETQLIGRNSDGNPWCQRCYAAVRTSTRAAARRAGPTAAVLAAVLAVEPALPDTTVLQVIDQAIGAHSLGSLARHLQAHPDVLLTGPTSMPPVLDRFVRALIVAGAQQILVSHPRCLECGRCQPARLHLAEGVLCSACHARRAGKTRCAGCGQPRRPYSRDTAGDPRCQGCVQRGLAATERTQLLTQLTEILAPQTLVDTATIVGVLSAVAPQQHQLRVLHGLLAVQHLTEPELPFVLSRLVIALRAAGADLPAPPCASCQQPTGTEVSLLGQRVRCRTCAWRCPTCGKARRGDDQRPCKRCLPDPEQLRGSCADCEQPERLLDDQGLCRTCRARAVRSCADCHQNLALSAIAGQKICQPCALLRTVEELLPDQPPGALHALRTPILAAEAMTTRRWLDRPLIAGLLADLDTGRLPLTHAALDAQPASRAVEHLRDLLLASGSLPPDPHRLLQQFQDSSQQLLRTCEVNDARIVRSWLRWQVLPRLRRHLEGPVDIRGAVWNAKRTLKQVVAFVTALEASDRTLASCEQADLDNWFSSRQATPHFVRPFLAWAQRTKHLPSTVTLPPTYQSQRELHIDPEQRWTIARRLVHDDTRDAVDRIAGALVVLYAQPLVRICALTTDDVQNDGKTITVHLGQVRLELQEPFATLIQLLPLRRRAGTAEQLPSKWLFPGNRAGRPLAPMNLGNRLRAIGIEPRRMRMAALDQLTKEIPPAMLAGVLGVNVAHTVRHTSQAGGDWAKYAASRST